MASRQRLLISMAAALVVLAAAACAQGSPGGSAASEDPARTGRPAGNPPAEPAAPSHQAASHQAVAPGHQPASQSGAAVATATAAAVAVAARVEEVGARYPDEYAGVEASGATLVVYRRPGPDLDDAVRAVAGDVPVVFRDAPHTRTELVALAERIQADAAYWRYRGIPIWTVLARHDGTGVEVGTPAGDRFEAAAPDRYGDVPIIVARMDKPPVTVPTSTG